MIWNARERVCGAEIEVDFENGIVLGPTACPNCGVSPFYVDLTERIEIGKMPGGVVEASADARDFAEQYGIDLSEIKPSGKNDTIILNDVAGAFAASEEIEKKLWDDENLSKKEPPLASPDQSDSTAKKVEATSAARDFAKLRGIDLSEIKPSGKNNKIIYDDVLAFWVTKTPAETGQEGGTK